MATEAISIRLVSAETSTTSAPTAATNGIPILPFLGGKRPRVHLRVKKAASSGTRTTRVKVFGYESELKTYTAPLTTSSLTAVASSAAWYEIFDTETVALTDPSKSATLSSAADYNLSFLLEGATDFQRLAVQVVTNGGTSPTLTVALAFGDDDRRG